MTTIPDDMVERVARALEDAEFGYKMDLVRLVDGVGTYRLRYSNGDEFEFGDTDECYEHIGHRRRTTQARAAIEAMQPAILAERERCAKICEELGPATQDITSTMICEALDEAAAAIRSQS